MSVAIGAHIEQQRVVLTWPVSLAHATSAVRPYDLVAEIVFAKDCVHHLSQVCVRLMVAVDIDATCLFQDALDLKHPRHHERDIGRGAVAVCMPSRVDQPVSTRAYSCKVAQPFLTNPDSKAPDVLKCSSRARLVGVLKPGIVGRCNIVHSP